MDVPERVRALMREFLKLPGIGPRQSSRFTYAVLDMGKKEAHAIAQAIDALHTQVTRCVSCGRAMDTGHASICAHCEDMPYPESLMILEKDQDLEAVERALKFPGRCFLLGGLITIDKTEAVSRGRISALHDLLTGFNSAREHFTHPIEVILALPTTPEGDATALYIQRVLEKFIEEKFIRLTRLARGLATGAELEYADLETIRHALENRK